MAVPDDDRPVVPPIAYRTSASTASRCASSSASLARVCSTTSAGARATNDSLASLDRWPPIWRSRSARVFLCLASSASLVDQSGQRQDDLGLWQHGDGAFGRALDPGPDDLHRLGRREAPQVALPLSQPSATARPCAPQ